VADLRPEVQRLVETGPLPDDDSIDEDPDRLDRFTEAVRALPEPLTDEEARALVPCFGPDDGYGVHWSLVHKIETAPGWPLLDALDGGSDNEWVQLLLQRARRGARS
jgi:hypothetical protein